MIKALLRALVCALVLVASTSLGVLTASPAGAEGVKELAIQADLAHGFTPKQPDLTTGTTVVWQNTDKIDYPAIRGAHTIVADDGSFASPEIAPGTSWSHTFLEPGTFLYHCSLHPNLLSGTLTVAGPKVEPPATRKDVTIVEPNGSVQKATYDPQDLAGVTGLTVTWRNQGAQPHTVTVDGGFDSGNIDPGKSWSRTFPTATSVAYYCTLHPWMTGTLRVAKEGAALPPPASRPAQHGSKTPRVLTPSQPARTDTGPVTMRVNAVEPQATNPQSWGFAPPTLTARVGDTVVWTNAGASPHTATASDRSFDSGTLAAGQTFSYKLAKTGSVPYVCTLHPWMKGTLQILAKGTATSVLGEHQKRNEASAPGAVDAPGAPTTETPEATVAHEPKRVRFQNAFIAGSLIFTLLLLQPAVIQIRRRRIGPLAPFEIAVDKIAETTSKREPLRTR